MTHKHLIIAGGSGFIGQACTQHALQRGYRITILSRHGAPEHMPEGVQWLQWDARSLGAWTHCLEAADAVINLVGRSVDCRKTPEERDEIIRSRVEATTVIGQALQQCKHRPACLIQMATAHIYGDPASCIVDETSAIGTGFAPEVGTAWEEACTTTTPASMRKVILRTSFVLGRNGGALQRLQALTRWGLGGTIGHGRQGISWIHEDDLCALILHAIDDKSYSGIYNATAPTPVSNREFMRELRKQMGAWIGLPAAAWMIRMAAPLIMRTDPELALLGRYCVSQNLERQGFTFAFDCLTDALANLCGAKVKAT